MHDLAASSPPPAHLAALAAAGALAPALILTAAAGWSPALAAVPAITFGIPALTAPALYVAVSLAGDAPPLLDVLRAVARALIAMAVMQLGLAIPIGFLVATASAETGAAIVGIAVALAAAVGVIRLRSELEPAVRMEPAIEVRRWTVEWIWLLATIAIVARLYLDAVTAVAS